MSINHTHDFGVLEELTAKNHAYITQATADGIPTIWVEPSVVLDVLLTLRTLPKPFVMLVDLSAMDERLRQHRHGLPDSDLPSFII